ncbi:hypothetical protein CNX65_21490 [Actinosynnema pretiosum]|uniref:Uncharacterized protein n=1 Tax=Actinosynnema pretiosum TaxID=42197 RepID=A0A290Z995_9PSEU|nr:hypothetical protein CNX65_21490 [Actinosynnema pretiosum]
MGPDRLRRVKQRSTTLCGLQRSGSKAGGLPPTEPWALRRAIRSTRSGMAALIRRHRNAVRALGWAWALSAITRPTRTRRPSTAMSWMSSSSGGGCGLSPT